LDPSTVRPDEDTHTEATPRELEQASSLPVQLAGALDERSFFARALATIHDEHQIERLQALLMLLVNKVMSADLVEPGDVAGAQKALERAVGYLGIGLEYLSRGQLELAGTALRHVALERVFRVGVSLTLQLRRLADTLVDKGGVQLDRTLLLDPPYDALVRSLRQQRPLLDDGSGPRPFRTLADIRQAAAALEEAS